MLINDRKLIVIPVFEAVTQDKGAP